MNATAYRLTPEDAAEIAAKVGTTVEQVAEIEAELDAQHEARMAEPPPTEKTAAYLFELDRRWEGAVDQEERLAVWAAYDEEIAAAKAQAAAQAAHTERQAAIDALAASSLAPEMWVRSLQRDLDDLKAIAAGAVSWSATGEEPALRPTERSPEALAEAAAVFAQLDQPADIWAAEWVEMEAEMAELLTDGPDRRHPDEVALFDRLAQTPRGERVHILRHYLDEVPPEAAALGFTSTPYPLRRVGVLPLFPLQALPPAWRRFVEMTSSSMGPAPDLLAGFTLPVIATIAAQRAHVRVRSEWVEPLCLYVVVAARPSAMKSPIQSAATEPLALIEQTALQVDGREVATGKSARRVMEKMLANLEAQAAKTDDRTKRIALQREAEETARDLHETPVPVTLQLSTSDATPEALARLIHSQGGRFAWLSSEGATLFESGARYSANKTTNIDVLLQGWSADTVKIHRVKNGDEPTSIPKAHVTIGIGIQPDVLYDGTNKALRPNGLLARFLYLAPKVEPVNRSLDRPDAGDSARGWTDLVVRLHEALKGHASTPRELTFTADAYQALTAWFAETHAAIVQGDLAEIEDWGSKLDGQTVRLAGLLALAADPHTTAIDLTATDGAIALARYFQAHALNVFAEMGGGEWANARYILERVRKKGWVEFTLRDLQRAVSESRFPSQGSLTGPLNLLVERGWVRELPPDPNGTVQSGRPTSPTYVVYPEVRP